MLHEQSCLAPSLTTPSGKPNLHAAAPPHWLLLSAASIQVHFSSQSLFDYLRGIQDNYAALTQFGDTLLIIFRDNLHTDRCTNTQTLLFFFCFLDSLTHYVRPDPMICQPHLFKILLKTFLLRIICLFFTCVFMVCIFLFCFYVLCLHMIMFIITVDGKCLIFYVKKVQNVQFIKIDFTYSLISALCDFSDIVFLFLGCLFLFLRCSIRCLLTTPLKSSPHKRSECCNSFVWKMCMISVRAIFFFLSLFSKSSILCGPFNSLQRVQEDQGYFQASCLCICVSLHLVDKYIHYILEWSRKRRPCWLCGLVFPSFCGLIQFQGDVRQKVLLQLLVLLCHSFPVVSAQGICTQH